MTDKIAKKQEYRLIRSSFYCAIEGNRKHYYPGDLVPLTALQYERFKDMFEPADAAKQRLKTAKEADEAQAARDEEIANEEKDKIDPLDAKAFAAKREEAAKAAEAKEKAEAEAAKTKAAKTTKAKE